MVEVDEEVYFTLRMPASYRRALDRLGQLNERTASAEARIAIRRHIEGVSEPEDTQSPDMPAKDDTASGSLTSP